MPQPFDYFVVFAEMRTGSNFLEANINEFSQLACLGEAFNPHFVCYPNKKTPFGITLAMREADPLRLIREMRAQTGGLAGFRFFHDHDPRVLDHCLPDPRCAKIILTRNPLESYVSWKIAQNTGQWKLTDARHKKTARVRFDAKEFTHHLEAAQAFQQHLLRGLQTTGQTAFYIAYEDIADIDVLNGMARFLGQTEQRQAVSEATKKQNPSPLRDKVLNFEEMQQALAEVDLFNLTRTPNFEPRRGPNVPSYVAAAQVPLMHLPLRTGLEGAVQSWLTALDGVGEDGLQTGFTQKTLRQWKRQHPGHRSFCVVRHPVARAHAAFCNQILSTGPGSFPDIRNTLRKTYKLPIPAGAIGPSYDRRHHRQAFLDFLAFVKSNLAGQTGVRVDAAWASQSEALRGFGRFALPDMVLRGEHLQDGLAQLAAQVGLAAPELPQTQPDHPFALQDFYDEDVEAAVRDVYQRDYMMFGYRAWDSDQAA